MIKIFKKKQKNFLKAFTLIELLISVSLIGILASVLFNNSFQTTKYRNLLANDADKMALYIRDVQNISANFYYSSSSVLGYGVYIDKASSTISSFYLDTINIINKDKKIENYKDLILDQENYISKIATTNLSTSSIHFLRPKLKAYINGTSTISKICIEIKSNKIDDVRKVEVYYVGQISTGFGNCN